MYFDYNPPRLAVEGRCLKRREFIFYWKDEIIAGFSGGLLMAAAFPPFPTRILSLVALVPLIRYFLVVFPRVVWRKNALKKGFWVGYLFGIAFFSILLYWIANLIPESSINMSWILIPAVILFVLYLSCFTGLFTLLLSWLIKRFGIRAVFTAPALWALIEFIRSNGELAFSWGLISSSLVPYPIALQGLSIYGPFGLSMVIVLLNVLIAFIIFSSDKKHKALASVVLAVVTISHLAYGNMRIGQIDRDITDNRSREDIAIVQPNVNLGIKWKPEYRDSIFVQIDELTKRGAELGAKLVIFPETAAPVSVSHSTRYRNWLKRISNNSGVDLLIGYINHIQEGEKWIGFNACGLFDKKGELTAQYEKIKLLPFGEKVPFSQYFPGLEKIDFGQANFKHGENMTIFDSVAGKFGTLICFESTFTEYARKYIRNGAQFLVNITNDGWFGSSRGAMQHAEMPVLRAVENGVSLIRAANTGISMSVDPAGRVKYSIDLNKNGMFITPVTILRKMTFYCKYGQLSFFLMFLGNLFIILLPVLFQKH